MQNVLLSGAEKRPEEIRLLDGMYRLRHTVFSERLKWTSLNEERREVDVYDALNPVYLICRDPSGDVIGCWRLLPTTGPYMLKDIFSHLLHGHPAPQKPDVWEISRFAIDPGWRDYISLGAVGSVVGHMLLGLFDFADENGITCVVAASDIRFDRILKRAGLTTTHYGPAVRMEYSRAVAGWAEISKQNRGRIEAKLSENQHWSEDQISAATSTAPLHPNRIRSNSKMAKIQALRVADIENGPNNISLKDLRQNLNELRQMARLLEQPAVEECLTLALELTSSRRKSN